MSERYFCWVPEHEEDITPVVEASLGRIAANIPVLKGAAAEAVTQQNPKVAARIAVECSAGHTSVFVFGKDA